MLQNLGLDGFPVDRIRIGAVADFIDVSRLWFPWIFNVADSAISIGICLLLLDMLRPDRAEQSRKAPAAPMTSLSRGVFSAAVGPPRSFTQGKALSRV